MKQKLLIVKLRSLILWKKLENVYHQVVIWYECKRIEKYQSNIQKFDNQIESLQNEIEALQGVKKC